jgi:hypothetical protein
MDSAVPEDMRDQPNDNTIIETRLGAQAATMRIAGRLNAQA